jgi:hypothetical protein
MKRPEDAEDPLLASLRELPRVELDQLSRERVRLRARAALKESVAAERGVRVTLSRAWSRAVAPALLTSATAVYLVWAVSFCASLYR